MKERIRTRKIMEILYVVHVETTTPMTSFGYAVTFVKNGSMGNVLRSLLHGLSTSNNTSALLALPRGFEHEGTGSMCLLF